MSLGSASYTVRPATAADEAFLWEMLYQALYIAPGQPLPGREVLQEPALAHYVAGWGQRLGDAGVVAVELDLRQPVGAAWLRLLPAEDPGWGFVDSATPELSMAVVPEHRGRGIGRRLLEQLIEAAAAQYHALSLSVDPANLPALRLYERFGFVTVGQAGTSLTMHKILAPTKEE